MKHETWPVCSGAAYGGHAEQLARRTLDHRSRSVGFWFGDVPVEAYAA